MSAWDIKSVVLQVMINSLVENDAIEKAAVHLSKRHGKSIEFYRGLLRNDPWVGFDEMVVSQGR